MQKEQATRLWNRLRANLLATQETIKEIIDNRAWEPLGYASFAEAWADRMQGIELAPAIRGEIVYAMFAEGATLNEVSEAVNLSDKRTEGMKQAYDLKLDAADADKFGETHQRNYVRRQAEIKRAEDPRFLEVSEHHRRRPGAWSKVHLEVGTETYQEWSDYAKDNNLNMCEWLGGLLTRAVRADMAQTSPVAVTA